MPDPLRLADPLALVTGAMAREVAAAHGVCGRPLIRRVLDRDTGTDTQVAIPCGSTRERVCPSCAAKARRLRIQQCAEGWHRDTEPDCADDADTDEGDAYGEDQVDDDSASSRRDRGGHAPRSDVRTPRTCLGCRSRTAPWAGPTPRRTVGSIGRRCSSPSPFRRTGRCGRVRRSTRTPTTTAVPRSDAVVFPRLVDRFWQNLRRVAGYRVQYFAAVEPQQRLAPHLHAAIRGTIPRQVIKQVVRATYLQVWWPSFDTAGLRRPQAPLGRPRLRRPRHRAAAADLAGSPGPGRPRHPRARGPVREAARHGRDRRPLGRCGPGDPVSDEVPHQVHRRRLHTRRRRRPRPIRATWRTSTGCMPSCSTCPVVSGARTGSATASNRWMPDLAWLLVGVAGKPMTGTISGLAAAVSSSPGSGPARPWPSIAPTAPPWSGKPWKQRGCSLRRSNAWPRPCWRRTASPGSCGPTPDPTRPPTFAWSWPPSPNNSAGVRSTRPPRKQRRLWTTVQQRHPDQTGSDPHKRAGRDHTSASPG